MDSKVKIGYLGFCLKCDRWVRFDSNWHPVPHSPCPIPKWKQLVNRFARWMR